MVGAGDAATDNDETASVKIVLDNLPDGATVEWPGHCQQLWSTLPLQVTRINRVNGMLDA